MLLFIKIEIVLQEKTGVFLEKKTHACKSSYRAEYNSGAYTGIIAGGDGGLTFYDVPSIPR